ncbi:MAG: L-seryl-tRNA(Sec) selenium transferase [candidate division Zixibacteria bacterium]|nr:L-seryl-tRNA(Sec) selenium transferase [candidate division Zixibacteria bacterium]
MAEKLIRQPRDFPSVEELLKCRPLAADIATLPRPIAAELVRAVVAENKRKLREGKGRLTITSLHRDIRLAVSRARRTEVTRVINATGIVVHTNLGRAPLSESLFDAIRQTVTGYSNVEFDLDRGVRGSRGLACENYLAALSGSEAATIVNNNAAALFLILNSLANRKQVLISRGELVQIGGGFRIPDILKRSGAKLCEVGTTNVTGVADYESHISERTGLILKVHKSNFVQAGFTEEVELRDLVALAARNGLSVVNDLGSGVFVPTKKLTGYAEPTVRESVHAGADLTCFSGDKMLGGVQAGLIVGRRELVAKIKRNPLFRTMRVDKIVFAILEKLLTIYLNGDHLSEIKLWNILSVPEAELYRRGRAMLDELGQPDVLSVEATKAYTGGGAMPEAAMPSVGLVFGGRHKAVALSRKFRQLETPVIGRIDQDRFILDLKAVLPDDLELLRDSIRAVIG